MAAGLFFILRPEPEPDTSVARVELPAPRATPSTPAPLPPSSTARARPSPRAVTPATDAAPAPVADPVVEAAPDAGTLRIESDVPGAQVFLDRQFLGTAPVTAQNVKPGTHQLNVSAEGFEGIARTVDVAVGTQDVAVRFREVRLDARIDVVHKHRIGSCRGRLVATPQGLRYETSDKEDAFTAALGELATFQVDYLEKNLRVKTAKGKQYNFTDPDGNADRLFVFHREVEKAREKLRAQ